MEHLLAKTFAEHRSSEPNHRAEIAPTSTSENLVPQGFSRAPVSSPSPRIGSEVLKQPTYNSGITRIAHSHSPQLLSGDRVQVGIDMPKDNDSIIPMSITHPHDQALSRGPRSSFPTLHPLPSKSVALELIMDMFSNFNKYFHVFDEREFLQQFEEWYLDSNPGQPDWWASINAVLALGHRFRAMRTLTTAYDNKQSCGYIHNAIAVISELSLMQQSLLAIQALLCIVLIIQATPNPHPASILIATTMRLAQSMGLHRKCQDPTLTETKIEQRRRVFWAVYFLDRDISLRIGQAYSQDDDDMDVELPSGVVPSLGPGEPGFCPVDFFNTRIGLAVLQGQIYKLLYSVRASQQSRSQTEAVALQLNTALLYWKSSVPIDFEDTLGGVISVPLSPEALHMLILRFTYLHCLALVDRHLPPPEHFMAEHSPHLIVPSESTCVVQSRKAFRLLQIAPQGDYACVWLLLQPWYAISTVLLRNVLRYPASPQALSDILLVNPFLQLLKNLAGDERQCSRSEEAKRMYREGQDLSDQATALAERALQMGFSVC
ncbi:uncharacterized protein E0L32_002353 [Thyridium curvatum]|uniref:Xylanolytic transcriptional activator regulatory domain-containing protein n=1 Tax=Thyridium curvatum TaxID=1093900 RepID=A0A507AJA0_9PEZI|nr:uncharacterized protein E0L32_002353 [Thyridium curvatum]TPX06857.1 hypothetical protein E0L32_002353 [Thyridium curvatum]